MSKFLCTLVLLLGAVALQAQNVEKKLEAVDDYIIEGNYEYAEKLLVKILRKDAGIHIAHYKLATVFWQTNKTKKALEEAVKAVRQKPENSNYQALLGKLWLENGQDDKAMEAFDAALLYDDQLPEVYLYRGDYYAEVEAWEDALKDYKVLSTLVSEDPEILFRMAHAYHGMKEYKRAANNYEKVLRLNPLDDESRYALAVCQYHNGIYTDAIFHLDQLINMNGELIDYLYQRALCYIDTKQLARAKTDLLKARELDKNQLDVNYALVGVEERMGNFDRAIVVLDQAIARFGGMHVQYMWKGRLQAKKGDFKEAYRSYVFAGESGADASLTFTKDLNTHMAIVAYLENEKDWIPAFEKCDPQYPFAGFMAVCMGLENTDVPLECVSSKELSLFDGLKDPLAVEGRERLIVAMYYLKVGEKGNAIAELNNALDATNFTDSEHHFAMVLWQYLSKK